MRITAKGSSSIEWLDRVADAERPGPDDVAVHTELELLLLRDPAIAPDHGQGGEVPQAGLGVEGRDHAPGDGVAHPDFGIPDADPPSRPRVLLVRRASVDLDEHSEPPSVDRPVPSAPAAELGDRGQRDKRDGLDVDGVARVV